MIIIKRKVKNEMFQFLIGTVQRKDVVVKCLSLFIILLEYPSGDGAALIRQKPQVRFLSLVFTY